jgi:hypothetical protein
MTATNYPQIDRPEHRLGLHYNGFDNLSPCASIIWQPKILKTQVESAKLG